MERQPEFELERAIAEWREQFVRLGGPEVDELVEHLREEYRRLSDSGLSREEAWLIATRRLGAPHAIEDEFAKVRERRHTGPLVLGFLALSCATLAQLQVVIIAMSYAARFGSNAAIAAGAAAALVSVFLLVRGLPALTSWTQRVADDPRPRRWIRGWITYVAALVAVQCGLGALWSSELESHHGDELVTIIRIIPWIDPATLALFALVSLLLWRRRVRPSPVLE